MVDSHINAIKQALSGCFDRVLDLFDGINLPEHKNELLCFAGIDSYRLPEAVAADEGTAMRRAEIKYLIKVLGKRNMSAADLCKIFDDDAVPALEGCGVSINEIKRCSCVYSREQGRYIVSAELVFTAEMSSDGSSNSVSFSIGNTSFGCMTSYEISNIVKTADTPTLGAGMITRIVGKKPLRVTLKGRASAAGASAAYSTLSAYLGIVQPTVTVGGIAFTSLSLTGLTLGGDSDGGATLTAEFTEVNEI